MITRVLSTKWEAPSDSLALYWLCWDRLKEWETPQDFLQEHSAVYQELYVTQALHELFGDENALPVDLSLFEVDEAGGVSVMEDVEVDTHLSELIAYVLSDFVCAGAFIEVRPSDRENPEVWAYLVKGVGDIQGLSLAWVNHEQEWVGPYVPSET